LVAVTFSADGETFINDASNFDSYLTYKPNGGTIPDAVGEAAGIYFSNEVGIVISGVFFPGDDSTFPNLLFNVSGRRQSTNAFQADTMAVTLNPSATVTPAKNKIIKLRWSPWGFGDANPPSSGETFIAGTWAVFGKELA
jgi:hypothetical protein